MGVKHSAGGSNRQYWHKKVTFYMFTTHKLPSQFHTPRISLFSPEVLMALVPLSWDRRACEARHTARITMATINQSKIRGHTQGLEEYKAHPIKADLISQLILNERQYSIYSKYSDTINIHNNFGHPKYWDALNIRILSILGKSKYSYSHTLNIRIWTL